MRGDEPLGNQLAALRTESSPLFKRGLKDRSIDLSVYRSWRCLEINNVTRCHGTHLHVEQSALPNDNDRVWSSLNM